MSVMKPALEPAAGFSLDSGTPRPNSVAPGKGQYSLASRALGLSTYFLSGALAINISQFLGVPLRLVNEEWYNAWIAFTKQSFGLLTMSLTQTFAPTKVIVSGDESVRGQLQQSTDGNLILDFPGRIILIANHQIYTDWLYLWWIAYCNRMHGHLYIILKESLKNIPILGWGMQLSQFIFLKRNWEQDRPNMANALEKLNKPEDPMWLLLFPEGTNLAASTREKSAAWAKRTGVADTKHVLLPRSTGLKFCIEKLRSSVDYIYDCTIVYEGVPRGQYAQDIFTLKAGYMEGRPPKSVNMYWRRFAIKDIPYNNETAFDRWLVARWREKDALIEQFYQTGKFPADKKAVRYKSGKVLRGAGHMVVPIRANHWYEFLQIFAPMGILAMVLYVIYGDLPQRYWKNINKQALQSGTEDIKKASLQAGVQAKNASTSLKSLNLDSFFDPGKQQETFKAGMMATQKLLNSPAAQVLLGRADFIQQFLSDPQRMVKDSITTKQRDFMRNLALEEAKRQRSLPAPTPLMLPGKRKGTFWKEIEAEENSRHGSVVSMPASKPSAKAGTFYQELRAVENKAKAPKGTFYKDLKAAKDKRQGRTATFWDDVKAEENSRYGTVVTLASDVTTAVASESSASTEKWAVQPSVTVGPSKTSITKSNPPLSKPKISTKAVTSPGNRPATNIPAKPPSKTTPKPSMVKQPSKVTTATDPAMMGKAKSNSSPTPLAASKKVTSSVSTSLKPIPKLTTSNKMAPTKVPTKLAMAARPTLPSKAAPPKLKPHPTTAPPPKLPVANAKQNAKVPPKLTPKSKVTQKG